MCSIRICLRLNHKSLKHSVALSVNEQCVGSTASFMVDRPWKRRKKVHVAVPEETSRSSHEHIAVAPDFRKWLLLNYALGKHSAKDVIEGANATAHLGGLMGVRDLQTTNLDNCRRFLENKLGLDEFEQTLVFWSKVPAYNISKRRRMFVRHPFLMPHRQGELFWTDTVNTTPDVCGLDLYKDSLSMNTCMTICTEYMHLFLNETTLRRVLNCLASFDGRGI